MKERFWEILETVFSDIFSLYKKYFLHWTVTRLIVWIYSTGAIVVLCLAPLAFGLISLVGADGFLKIFSVLQKAYILAESWVKPTFEWLSGLPHFSGPLFALYVGIAFIGLVIALFLSGYANGILLNRAYRGYIDENPVDHGAHPYFSWTYIRKYIALKFVLFGLYVAGVIIVAIPSIIVAIILSVTSSAGVKIVLGILAATLVIGFIFGLIYVSIRLVFTEILLANTENIELPVFEYVKRSWAFTRGRAGWIFAIGLISGLAIGMGSGMISGIVGFIPYAGTILSLIATGSVAQMIYVSVHASLQKMDKMERAKVLEILDEEL